MCSYPEAIKKIIALRNLDITVENSPNYEVQNEVYSLQRRIELALKLATIYYSDKMVTDVNCGMATKHLQLRRIRPETAFKFQIGFAPQPTISSPSKYNNANNNNDNNINIDNMRSITANLTAEGFSMEELIAAGLSVDSSSYNEYDKDREKEKEKDKWSDKSRKPTKFDRFRRRLMVPIKNENGVVIAFGGRILDDMNLENVPENFPGNVLEDSEDHGKYSFLTPENLAQLAAASSSSGRGRYTGKLLILLYHN